MSPEEIDAAEIAVATLWASDRRRSHLRAPREPKPEIVRVVPPKPKYGLYGPHPKWRRVTGITFAVEAILKRKQRKKGLKRLERWLEKNWKGVKLEAAAKPTREGEAPAEPPVLNPSAVGQACVDATAPSSISQTDGAVQDQTSSNLRGAQTRQGSAGASPSQLAVTFKPTVEDIIFPRSPADLSLIKEWSTSADSWSCVKARGPSLESLCRDLQIVKPELNHLMQEHCGLNADEVIDNFRLSKLRGALRDRVRQCARELWGSPGDVAMTKVHELREAEEFARQKRVKARLNGDEVDDPQAGKREFPSPTGEEREIEKTERTAKLLRALEQTFDHEMWAQALGFTTLNKLKNACLRVLGRTLKSVMRIVAEEVVTFYIASEWKAMRRLASEDSNDIYTRCARRLYWNSLDKPGEPFVDEWSAYEELKRDWLEGMVKEFG